MHTNVDSDMSLYEKFEHCKVSFPNIFNLLSGNIAAIYKITKEIGLDKPL